MSLNTSATFTFVLALVSQKNRLFSSAYACVCPPQRYQMPSEGANCCRPLKRYKIRFCC